ncbi:DUF3093 domain-containing protein [Natronoglycomyces albus]|uniref:DUF3093 domain-containing protein n=2 Tax=Natronoglycomyces albus TaxID=2811108 RepID=A0A895XTJ6_9ACTN|nr:DUF3093 domain-containing protein [Natronoglycomyces albus]
MYTQWWMWLLGASLGVGAGALFFMGVVEWWRIAPMVVFPLVVWGALWWIGRVPIRVSSQNGAATLFVDDANVPLRHIGEVDILRDTARRDAMSVSLHPLAFVIQRPWISSAVRIHITDAEDPTPYWIISTRQPEKLRDTLTNRSAPSA